MEESTDVQLLQTQEGVYVDTIDTTNIPEIENPDEREYEQIENKGEGGL